MKKAFLYVSLAIVLGVSIMLFPLWTFFRSYNKDGMGSFMNSFLEIRQQMEQASTTGNYDDYRARTQPADASLQILAIGFIAAMVAYLVVRRRVPRPTYRFWPY